MTGIYYVEAADVLRAAGLTVVELQGWQTRARSSGGFPSGGALGVQWHHTASKTSPENDTNYMFFTAQDRPIGNGLITRTGEVWLGAAGAANTAGKGGPVTMSRGVVPVDGANARTWAWEVANNGVGEPWPEVQIDAYFAASNAMNALFGNRPDDVFSHAISDGGGWTSRKIDPATAAAVQGRWRPRSIGSSGTWSLADIRAEAGRRASTTPTPPTPPDNGGDDDMALTDDDIDRIAKAVWKYQINDPSVTKMIPADTLLGRTRAAAANADRQTRPDDAMNTIAQEVWTHPDRTLTP